MFKQLNYALMALLILPFFFLPAMAETNRIQEGKEISFDRKKGNCLACHAMDDGELAGLVGPPLMMMKLRFPDKAVLKAQIWDATERNPATSMPPFGRHRMLTEDEIDKVVEYLYTL
ncbi:MAG TPA: sulfur oxidation c-type cytochrome SoxX [Gammaproteobacteria bacterium]|nr:sulfur oxidation c-type cytochrome SoxX [Gammaproteobacteria bacterium]